MALLLITSTLVGCRAADRASYNISKESDEFRVVRRIVFYNAITDNYILELTGNCSIKVNGTDNDLAVTCKVGDGRYQKHFLGLSDNVTYVVEQLETVDVSTYKYELIFKPESIIPMSIEIDAGY